MMAGPFRMRNFIWGWHRRPGNVIIGMCIRKETVKRNDMNTAKTTIFHRKTPEEKLEHKEMVKQIVKSCMTSSCIVLGCIILFELFFYVNSIKHPKSFRNLLVWYQGCYVTLLFSSIICLILCIFCWCNYEKRYRYMKCMSPVYSFIIVAWALTITYLDCLKSQKCSPILFMTILLCIPACMYMNPVFYLILDLAASAVMLWMAIYAPGGGDSADILNLLVFMIIQVIVSMFFLSTKYGYYRSVRQSLLNEQKARKAVEAKAATLSNMSHELRTPLNAILGMNELIVREDKGSLLGEYTDNIRLAGDNLQGLINDMLDFSKLEAGKMTVNAVSYNLAQLLGQVYNIMYVLAEKKGLSFRIQVEQNTPKSLKGDSKRISQLMINLVNNAVKYTKTGGVSLSVGFDVSVVPKLCVRVEDTGIGIKEQDIPYLFDAFSRVEDEQNHHIEGTGLGLMICDRFVRLMHGEIGVESTYGKGSVFWFRIPQEVVDAGEMEQTCWGPERMDTPSQKPQRERTALPDRQIPETEGRPRVLVVDDTPMNISVFKKLLEKEPLIVDTADSGEQCLSMIEDSQYDMIFLDHMMPGMDGVETLKNIRSFGPPWCKEIKIVALTAGGGDEAKEEYLQMGFDDYLAKPILFQKLLDIVTPLYDGENKE